MSTTGTTTGSGTMTPAQTRRQSEGSLAQKLRSQGVLPAWVEALLFVAASFAVAALQVFVLAPNMTLLFDSQGYLAIASCIQGLRGVDAAEVMAACGSEAARLELARALAPIADIVKSGPIVPSILAGAYAVSGKTIGAANWAVAALAMLGIFSATVGAGYLTARRLWGAGIARIAGTLFMLYPGFLVNAGRPLSEIPALAIETFAFLFLYILFVPDHKEQLGGGSAQSRSSWVPALGLGLCTGLLMLARPTLLPLPALLVLTIALVLRACAARKVFSVSKAVVAVSAMAVVLGAWAFTKFALTGTPSITVDRHGPWNLYAGASVETDGWDVLPSAYVSHPEQFKMTMPDAAIAVLAQAAQSPVEALGLVLRKPARLAGAPWNDFQVPVLAVPWLAQRFVHQLLLMCAFFGFWQLIDRGLARRGVEGGGRAEFVVASTLALTTLYHLICCCFITMSRYFFTAMAPVLWLAAFGIWSAWRQNVVRRPLVLVSLVLVPLSSLVLEWLTGDGAIILTELGRMNGQTTVAVISAAMLAISAVVACYLLAGFRRGWSAWICGGSILAAGVFTCAPCYRTFATAAGTYVLNPAREKSFECVVSPVDIAEENVLYLVLDKPHLEGARNQSWTKALQVRINGKAAGQDWRPLSALDASQRENLTYQTVFAYSSGKEVSDFKQWMCLPIEAGLLRPGINKVALTATAPIVISANLIDPGTARVHSVALRNFSWSKGFFADSPGESRVDSWDIDESPSTQPHLSPRMMLLTVARKATSNEGLRSSLTIALPDQIVGKGITERVKEVTVSADQLGDVVKSTSPNCALRLQIEADVQSTSPNASVAVVESLTSTKSNTEEFAPLSPIAFGSGALLVDDLIPLAQNDSHRRLEKIRLVFSGQRWWDILAYGNFKAAGRSEFRNLKLTASVEPIINLDRDPWRTIPLREAKSSLASSLQSAIGE